MSERAALSQEELRKRLYQTFKEKGVLDSLKTQLRNHLIHELKHRAFSGTQGNTSENLNKESLIDRASNSLVADHLARCGYEYTLSVFYPECGLEREKALNISDILQLMKIHPKSKLYKLLTSKPHDRDGKGFLLQVLREIMEHRLQIESRDADTQTVATSSNMSVVEKLQLIDEQFEEKYLKCPNFETLELKLSEYRREMEEQLQLEMSQKLQHFKDVEIATIKLEVKEKSQKEIAEFQRQLEKTYELKSEGLSSRERNAIERLQRQQEIEAKEMYSQRQAMLKDIELVRNRETDLRQRLEAFELAQKMYEERNKSVDDLLRKRGLEVRKLEENFENKLKDELLRHQIELKEQYLKRTQKVSEDERRNKEEAVRMREESIILNLKRQDVEKAMSHTQQLEIEVEALKVQLSLLTKQNHQLTEKLKETVDYPLIMEEKKELQAQARSMKQQMEEIRKENQLLRESAIKPAAELAALQGELRRIENARKLDQDASKMRKELLERQLQAEVDRCAELKMQLLSTEDSARKLNAEVEQLEFQLRHTRQAFEKEVYRNPKPSVIEYSVLGFNPMRTMAPYSYTDKDPLKSHLGLGILEAGDVSTSHFRRNTRTRSCSPDSDLEFVANTKAKIKELEKDAEYLEEAYRNYKDRLIHTAEVESITQSNTHLRRGLLKPVSAVSRQKVNFLDDSLTPPQHVLLNRLKSERREGSVTEEKTPTVSKISSSRRLSSTPKDNVFQSLSEKGRISSEDHNGSYIASSHHSQRLSPIQKMIKSPALHQDAGFLGIETGKGLVSSDSQPSESEPCEHSAHSKPKKLDIDDLAHSDSSLHDQEDIPEQLEFDISHHSEHLVHDNPFPADLPRTPVPQLDSLSSHHKHEVSIKQGCEERIKAGHSQNDSGEPQAEYYLEKETDPQEVIRESPEDISVVEKISNDSIASLSHGGADDDFW
uniref:OFD1 centriole and centriolar satellite protein n=1 Tax=Leptobrachium leishanense TaxID=445787 RepID=A0A8C5LX11_9ANUR